MPSSIGDSLNRAWRVLATGLSFAVFGVGGLLLGAIVCMAMRLIISDPERRAQSVRRLVSASFRLFVAFMAQVGVLRWRVSGLEHWQRGRAVLVVANHPTLIDIVFLIGLFDGADCVVKADVMRNPAWGLLARSADYVSNGDPALLLEECARRLQAGRTVIMFPEGTRTVPGAALQFGAAAGAIAVRSACDCLPVVITCEPPTLYKGLPWYRVPSRRAEFRLRICPVIQAPPAAGVGSPQRHAGRLFVRELERFFSVELAAAGSAPAAGGSQPASMSVL